MGQAETDFFGNLVAGVRFLEWTLIFGCPISTPIVRPHYVRKPIEKTTALCTVLYVHEPNCKSDNRLGVTGKRSSQGMSVATTTPIYCQAHFSPTQNDFLAI